MRLSVRREDTVIKVYIAPRDGGPGPLQVEESTSGGGISFAGRILLGRLNDVEEQLDELRLAYDSRR
jgi:hypothetical protein